MLNPFPTLLVYSLLAPVIIRIGVAIVFLGLSYRHLFSERQDLTAKLLSRRGAWTAFLVWYLGLAELIIGGFLLMGFLTQPAAIGGVLLSLNLLNWKGNLPDLVPYSKIFYFLLIAACLSLLFSGAGAFAFDMPL